LKTDLSELIAHNRMSLSFPISPSPAGVFDNSRGSRHRRDGWDRICQRAACSPLTVAPHPRYYPADLPTLQSENIISHPHANVGLAKTVPSRIMPREASI
jgi:hypothetical protein